MISSRCIDPSLVFVYYNRNRPFILDDRIVVSPGKRNAMYVLWPQRVRGDHTDVLLSWVSSNRTMIMLRMALKKRIRVRLCPQRAVPWYISIHNLAVSRCDSILFSADWFACNDDSSCRSTFSFSHWHFRGSFFLSERSIETIQRYFLKLLGLQEWNPNQIITRWLCVIYV